MDLRSLCGERYRIMTEEGGEANSPESFIVRCKHGHIYQHGAEMLGAATNRAGTIAQRLADLRCVSVWQDGSDGVNVIFDPAHFEAVAALMKPRIRRRLSADHRAKLLAASAPYRFSAASEHDSDASDSK